MRIVIAFVAGLVFGLGLVISQMASPAKVLSFLDLAGGWDPSLAIVMIGALLVGLPAFALARRRTDTWLGQSFAWPDRHDIDRRLLAGAGLFGVGWGLVGLCPGPAWVNLTTGRADMLIFVAAMLVGMGLHAVTGIVGKPRDSASA